jgi:hypothetical protein
VASTRRLDLPARLLRLGECAFDLLLGVRRLGMLTTYNSASRTVTLGPARSAGPSACPEGEIEPGEDGRRTRRTTRRAA